MESPRPLDWKLNVCWILVYTYTCLQRIQPGIVCCLLPSWLICSPQRSLAMMLNISGGKGVNKRRHCCIRFGIEEDANAWWSCESSVKLNRERCQTSFTLSSWWRLCHWDERESFTEERRATNPGHDTESCEEAKEQAVSSSWHGKRLRTPLQKLFSLEVR